jgi:hypothetical protein
MRSLREVASQELVWKQPSGMKRIYELHVGEEVLATLRWQKLSGTLAQAETAEGNWTFKRSGFLHPVVTVRNAGSDVPDIAVFEPSWTGKGTLQLPENRSLRWASTNFWHSEWAWLDNNGNPLISFKNKYGWTKVEGQVEVAQAATNLPEFSLLITLGWYLMVQMASDASASTAATTAAVASM